ncbi:carbohydrate kinase [Ochrobactrum soli]|uniref:Carbohydrate kinase n=1 Tax=Ochrobactrum soli TaxID=2448455 RepID=A0A849KEE7_9HYPH|nr:FGGY family carbohydrate kinase [[Ochrobactrum] soli]NNU59851.1 carbohydrate kinase [[Ochrobactrum] soli]RLL74616.1 carbohydrate kinase [[Ochrobactrum] soli]
MSCVLGLDIGTTSTIGILVRLPDEVLGITSRPVTLTSRQPGWAEEDPEQWWSNCCAIIQELIGAAGISTTEIVGVGVTGMLPAVVLLDENGAVLRPSIQQSDGRVAAEVAELRSEIEEVEFIAKAGNGINQQLVATKLRWIERHEPEVFAKIATVFGSYDYINWKLTGERRIEQNWALEAGFVDIATNELSPELIALTHLPLSVVPAKVSSHAVMGTITKSAALSTGLAEGTPVVGGAADMIASALAAGVSQEGQVLLKFGGALDILVATAKAAPDPRMFLDYHLVPGLYMPNGCMSTGGSGLNWFAENFAGGEKQAAVDEGLSLHQHLDTLAAKIDAGADGVAIVPYFLGEKTPIHDPFARGTITGLSLNHKVGHVWRALLEAYAYAARHHIEVLQDMGHHPKQYLASDGGANSRVWMQIVADVLQAPIRQLKGHPGSSLGAAWAAAVGANAVDGWSGIAAFVENGDLIQPRPENAVTYNSGYQRFREIYTNLKPLYRE